MARMTEEEADALDEFVTNNEITLRNLTYLAANFFAASVKRLIISPSSGKSGSRSPASGAVTGGYSAQESRVG